MQGKVREKQGSDTAEIVFATATDLACRIRTGSLSATAVLEAHLAHIAQHNGRLNAIVTLNDRAREEAAAADAALARGEARGALHGVPLTIKEVFETADLRTTCGSRKLAHYVPTSDAVAVAKLRAAGAVILGKTNMPSLGRDFQSNNRLFGRTRNPWKLTHTPGGSSGGEAAAVAAGLSPLGLGSDVGGSIRIPAHFCGIYGLKPTEGMVSSVGTLPPLPWEAAAPMHMRAFGPLARSVADLRLCLSVIAERPLPPSAPLSVAGLRLAWTDEIGAVPTTAATRAALRQLATVLSDAGATVVQTAPPDFDWEEVWQTFGRILGSEGRTTTPWLLRQLAGRIGTRLVGRQPSAQGVLTGLILDEQGYAEALAARAELTEAMESFLGEFDGWLLPVAAGAAFPHRLSGLATGTMAVALDELRLPYWVAGMAYTTPFNVTGNPVVVVPLGHTPTGLPLGVQLVGQRWQDGRLLDVATAIDGVVHMYQRPPGYLG